MKNIVLKGTVCVFLAMMLLVPISSGLSKEIQNVREVIIYRCSPAGIEEVTTEVAVGEEECYRHAVGNKCRELCEEDAEMQRCMDKALVFSEKTAFDNATLCIINSSGRGIHMQLILQPWLFSILLSQVVSFLNSVGLENIADALLEILDFFDVENSSMNMVMRSRYWSADSHTVIEPLMGEPIELNGNHRLITLGFIGYVSYSRLCRILRDGTDDNV